MAVGCPTCHVENTEDSQFCKQCASPLHTVGNAPPLHTKTLESPVFIMKPGDVLADRYEVHEKIGEGGMGEVYRALDRNLDRQVAVKVLPSAFASPNIYILVPQSKGKPAYEMPAM